MTTNEHRLQRYYGFHASVYDATRWSFLFGREQLLKTVASLHQPARILEIGCGTGRNLAAMTQLFPNAQLTGIDLSAAMLEKAWRRLSPHVGRVKLLHQAYNHPIHGTESRYDLIVCSYALTMFNPGWENAIACAKQDLADGGLFALVDFHRSPVPAFRRWMGLNHVRMDGHLLPVLCESFRPVIDRTTDAYAGLWQYLTFIGRKDRPSLS
jgi:S-adenosylmethionine-diacylgycerolhomoserine-N-methlytransferase